MQGNIDFTGSLSGAISGGGSGGSDVTITPTLQSGIKIADYTIDETSGSLYAPTPEGLAAEFPLIISDNTISIDLSNYVTETDLNDYQEKLTAGNYISIDSNNEISCTPPITNVWYTPEAGVQQDILIGKLTVNEVTQNVYAPSAVGVNYSTTEQKTGVKWIDGKDIYQKTIVGTLTSAVSQFSLPNVDTYIKSDAYLYNNGKTYLADLPYWETTNFFASKQYDYINETFDIVATQNVANSYPNLVATIYYTKLV